MTQSSIVLDSMGSGGPPRQLTSFVGREGDLLALDALLDVGRSLVTVLGPPGIGKTRLIARWLDREDPERPVIFCDLRGVESAHDLIAALAESLDGRLEDGEDLQVCCDSVAGLLAERGRLRVVLDNFEQLVPDGVAVVRRWLHRSPGTSFVITSRQLLRLEGEIAYELSPLRLEPDGEAGLSEAARLFLDRAKEAEPRFVVDESVVPDVERLVSRLEGLPLAIELAASQMRQRRPADLFDALGRDSFIDLQSCHRDVDPRHASLKVAIAASWKRLAAQEQGALRQLSIFRQGFDLEAATQVLVPEHEGCSPPIGEVVAALRDASLLRVDSDGASSPMRWSLYESVREFVAADGDEESAARHARYFLSRATDWVWALRTAHSAETRVAIGRDLANLRAAFEWFASQGSAASTECARLALALYEVYRIARPALAVAPLSIALERLPTDRDAKLVGRLRLARGVCYRSVGEPAKTEADFDAIEAMAPEPSLAAELEFERGVHRFHLGRLAEAKRSFETSLDASRGLEERHLEGRSEMRLAWVLVDGYQDDAAFEHYRRAIDTFHELDDARGECLARSLSAVHGAFHQRGRPRRELEEQVAQARMLGDVELEAAFEIYLGICLADEGKIELAISHFARASQVSRACGHKRNIAHVDLYLGAAHETAGRPEEARRCYVRSIAAFRTAGDERLASHLLSRLAIHWARDGDFERARDALDQSRASAMSAGDGAFALMVEIQTGRVIHAEGHAALAGGDVERAARSKAEAQSTVQRALSSVSRASRDLSGQAILARSPEVRWAWRLFDKECGVASAPLSILRVWSDGGAFQIGSEPAVSVAKGATIRSVLRALAEARCDSPGRSVSVEDLMKRCWSDERLSPLVGSQRVRNIIARLRKAGLADVIRRDGAGYLIPPEVHFGWVETAVRTEEELGPRGL